MPNRHDPTPDVAMPFLLMRSFRALVDEVHAELEELGYAGVRANHGFALQAIGSGCTSVVLAQRLGVTKQAATKTVRALEDMGLVERIANDRDRREKTLRISEKGHRLLDVSARCFGHAVGRWRAQIGDEAIDHVLRALSIVSAGGRRDTDLSDWQ